MSENYAVRTSGTYLEHNKAELIRGGKHYFEALLNLISSAKTCIHLQVYIYDEDETGLLVKRELIRAAERGVQVYMVLDGYASRNISDEFIRDLISSHIHFRWFEPFFKSRYFYFGRRLHHKLFVADNMQALVGGVNISNRYNDLPGAPAWMDWAIMVEGEIAERLSVVAIDVWKQARWSFKKEDELPPLKKPALGTEICPIRTRQNDWVRNKNQISRSYLEMFRKSNSHITMMSSYFLPGNLMRRQLVKACKRGVKVKIIIAGKYDVFISKQAERYMYRWLLANNVEIYEYNKTILHGKLATYDGIWTTVGSYNFNYISTYASVELNLDILNREFAEKAELSLNEIMNTDCMRITIDDFRTKYNLFSRIVQWASYRLIRLIFYTFTFYFKRHH